MSELIITELGFELPPAVTIGARILTRRCRECGCTDENACLDPETLQPCAWANPEFTVCTVCSYAIAASWGLPFSSDDLFES